MNGVVLIDKPPGCTSHDVVDRWRKLAGTTKAGHLGTLDPMATGLLVLVSGNATRLAQFLQKEDKTYLAEIRLGVISNTYDVEGQLQATGIAPPGEDAILHALTAFTGKFEQRPPPVSAKKVGGVRAYKMARNNIPFELKPVEVNIRELELVDVEPGRISICVTCSAGTYIRSLAHDVGQRLGCGAVLGQLRRTRVGAFELKNSYGLDQLNSLSAEGRLAQAVLPAGSLLPHIPSQHVSALSEVFIRQGRDFHTSPFVIPPGTPTVKALSLSGELIAIGELRIPNLYHPSIVF